MTQTPIGSAAPSVPYREYLYPLMHASENGYELFTEDDAAEVLWHEAKADPPCILEFDTMKPCYSFRMGPDAEPEAELGTVRPSSTKQEDKFAQQAQSAQLVRTVPIAVTFAPSV